ncbi:MAG: type III-B CRISPR module-associated protein Cmr3 [Gammaproteobacteria bacterium]|nr:type III-B CRISPR module-associated protein Cmr3 [Gammaproteobacteria bacterium]
MTTFILTPLDTLFFRDGQPFNQGEGGNNVLSSLFPPAPTTVVGALRAALAREQGWQAGEWTDQVKSVLGDGDRLGQLSFRGPYLVDARDNRPLFPLPQHIVGKPQDAGWSHITRLRPGACLSCDPDLEDARLPVPENSIEGLKNRNGAWVTFDGMAKILHGNLPAPTSIVRSDALWSVEPRTGIQRNSATHATESGALYATRHIRLSSAMQLAMEVAGLPQDWLSDPKDLVGGGPMPVGGESRMAWIEMKSPAIGIEVPACPPLRPKKAKKLLYTVTVITPADIPDGRWKKAGSSLDDKLPGTIVSACVAKPLRVGGWDTEGKEPLPLKSLLPAGSTWFMEAPEKYTDLIKRCHGQCIGMRTEWGYGQMLIGLWREGRT